MKKTKILTWQRAAEAIEQLGPRNGPRAHNALELALKTVLSDRLGHRPDSVLPELRALALFMSARCAENRWGPARARRNVRALWTLSLLEAPVAKALDEWRHAPTEDEARGAIELLVGELTMACGPKAARVFCDVLEDEARVRRPGLAV